MPERGAAACSDPGPGRRGDSPPQGAGEHALAERSVLIVAFHFPPVAGSSGLHRVVSMARELLRAGCRVHVLSVSLNCYARVDEANLAHLPEGVVVHRAPAFDSVRTLSVRRRYPAFFKVPDPYQSWIVSGTALGLWLVRRHRIGWVLSSYPFASAHCIGDFVSRWSRARWIADFRDPMAQPGYPPVAAQYRAFLWVEQRAVARADLLTFATDGARDYYLGRFAALAPARAMTISNGYDETLFEGLDAGPAQQQPKVLLHSGALYPSERDPRQLLDALADLQEALLAGGFVVRLRATGHDTVVRAQIRERGLERLVEVAPLVSNRDALAEMMQAYCLLVLQAENCNDQIPAKIYEYLRSGRPIACLAHPDGETHRALQDQPGCWCAPLDDRAAIRERLAMLCLEEDLSHYQRPAAAVARFERGAQTRALIRWLDARGR